MSSGLRSTRPCRFFVAARAGMLLALLMLVAGTAVADAAENQRLTIELEQARQAYDRAAASASGDGDSAAHLPKLKNAYEKKRTTLEKARINSLVEYSGRDPQFVENLRSAGNSWIDVSNELNVHPSVIGIELIDDRPPPFAAP